MVKNTLLGFAKTATYGVIGLGSFIASIHSIPNWAERETQAAYRSCPELTQYFDAKKRREHYSTQLNNIPQSDLIVLMAKGASGINAELGGIIEGYQHNLILEKSLLDKPEVKRAASKLESIDDSKHDYNVLGLVLGAAGLMGFVTRGADHMIASTKKRIKETRQ